MIRPSRQRRSIGQPKSPARRGFSLLEILLALAILGTSLAILSQIGDTGVDASRQARALALTRVLAQAQMSEVLINAELGQSPTSVFDQQAEPFDSGSLLNFTYSIEVQPATLEGILIVRVTTKAADSNDYVLANYVLDRWMIDPDLGLVELELEEEAAKELAAGTATEEEGV